MLDATCLIQHLVRNKKRKEEEEQSLIKNLLGARVPQHSHLIFLKTERFTKGRKKIHVY